jgi:LEA14-like dessication related protein
MKNIIKLIIGLVVICCGFTTSAQTIMASIDNSENATGAMAQDADGQLVNSLQDPEAYRSSFFPVDGEAPAPECTCDNLIANFTFVINSPYCSATMTAAAVNTCFHDVHYDWNINGVNVGSGITWTQNFPPNTSNNVCLTVTSTTNSGVVCSKKICKKVTMKNCDTAPCNCDMLNPDFQFSTNDACVTTFTAGAVPSCFQNVHYEWIVNGSSMGGTPVWSYNFPPGSVNQVCLVIVATVNGQDCVREVCHTVVVDCAPPCNCDMLQPTFQYSTGANCVTTFTAGAVPTCFQNVQYQWNVNGSPVGSGSIWSYSFPPGSINQVCLTIVATVNGQDCAKKICQTVVVDCVPPCNCDMLQPTFQYGTSTSCVTTFTAGAIPACFQNVQYQWSVNGTPVGSGAVWNYSFPPGSINQVCLTIVATVNGHDCVKKTCKTVIINCETPCNCNMLQPTYQFFTSADCITTFTAGAVPTCFQNVHYQWSVNGSPIGSGAVWSYMFPPGSINQVCLTIIATVNGQDCVKKVCHTVINDCGPPCSCNDFQPTFQFSTNKDCYTTFTAGVVPECFQDVHYVWTVNGNPSASGPVWGQTFPAGSTNVICLTVIATVNGQECVREYCQEFTSDCQPPCNCDMLNPMFSYTLDDHCYGTFGDITGIPKCLQEVHEDWYVNGVLSGSGPAFGFQFGPNSTNTICVVVSGYVNGKACKRQYCVTIQTGNCGEEPCNCEMLDPEFVYTVDNQCNVTFNLAHPVPDCFHNVQYHWTINGVPSASTATWSQQFMPNTSYQICLVITATTANGERCVREICHEIYTGDCIPVTPCTCDSLNVDFTYSINAACVGTFTSTSQLPSCYTDVQYLWYINGVYPSTASSFNYQLSAFTTYQVCLYVTVTLPDGTKCTNKMCRKFTTKACQDPCNCDTYQPTFSYAITADCITNLEVTNPAPECFGNAQYIWYVNGVPSGSGLNWSTALPPNSTNVICLRVFAVVNGEECMREYCQTITNDCGTDPCRCDLLKPSFTYSMDEHCFITVGGVVGVPQCMQNVQYTWIVNGNPLGTGPNWGFQGAPNTVYTICLLVTGVANGERCRQEYCQTVQTNDCNPDPCNCELLNPEFTYTVDHETCTAVFYLANPIPDCFTNVHYTWYVNGVPTATSAVLTQTFTPGSTNSICVVISADMPNGEHCVRESCQQVTIDCDPGPCNCDMLKPFFLFSVDQHCLITFDNITGVPYCMKDVKYDWTVNGVYSGSGTGWSYQGVSNTAYTICLTISGIIDGKPCRREFCQTIETGDCGVPCTCDMIDPTFTYAIDVTNCGAIFSLATPVPGCFGNVQYTWIVNGAFAGNGTSLPYNFAPNSFNVVCLIIDADLPNGEHCRLENCQNVVIDCGVPCNCEMLNPAFTYLLDANCNGTFTLANQIPGCFANVTYAWYVNGILVGTGAVMNHTFVTGTINNICLILTATTPDGETCIKSVCKKVTANCGTNPCTCEMLSPAFSYMVNTNECTATFSLVNPVPACFQNVQYQWKVNGVIVSTSPVLNYPFPSGSINQVCLILTATLPNGDICTRQTCKTLVMDCTPCSCDMLNPEFSFVVDASNCSASFNLVNQLPSCFQNVSQTWYVNGVPVASGPTLNYVFAPNSTNEVCTSITVTLPNGQQCSQKSCQKVTIDCGDQCTCELLQPQFTYAFNDNCLANFGNITGIPACFQNVQYEWYVNGVLYGTGPTFSYQFPPNTNLQICLTVTGTTPSGETCTREFCEHITSANCQIPPCPCNLDPWFNFSLNQNCFATFTGFPGGSSCLQNIQYRWYVNGVLTGTGQTWGYQFSSNTSYNICLRVIAMQSNGQKCVREWCRTITTNECAVVIGPPAEKSMSTGGTEDHSVILYPNPTSGEINLEFDLNKDANVSITLRTMDGKEIQTQSRQSEAGRQYVNLEVPESVVDGIIFVEVVFGDIKIVKKVAVSKH